MKAAKHPLVGKPAIHVVKVPVSFTGTGWKYETERREVVVMAVAGTWAMVRRKGCMPYTAMVKELEPPTGGQADEE